MMLEIPVRVIVRLGPIICFCQLLSLQTLSRHRFSLSRMFLIREERDHTERWFRFRPRSVLILRLRTRLLLRKLRLRMTDLPSNKSLHATPGGAVSFAFADGSQWPGAREFGR